MIFNHARIRSQELFKKLFQKSLWQSYGGDF
jgi:hypothetical protein